MVIFQKYTLWPFVIFLFLGTVLWKSSKNHTIYFRRVLSCLYYRFRYNVNWVSDLIGSLETRITLFNFQIQTFFVDFGLFEFKLETTLSEQFLSMGVAGYWFGINCLKLLSSFISHYLTRANFHRLWGEGCSTELLAHRLWIVFQFHPLWFMVIPRLVAS